MKNLIILCFLLITLPAFAGTFDLTTDLKCEDYLNGGKLTTLNGKIICADDESGFTTLPQPQTISNLQDAINIPCGSKVKFTGDGNQTLIGKHCEAGKELTILGKDVSCSSGTCVHVVDSSYIIFDGFTIDGGGKSIGFRAGEDDASKYADKSTHHITLKNSEVKNCAHWGVAFSQNVKHPTHDIIVDNNKIHDVSGSSTESSSNGHCVKFTSWDKGGKNYAGNGYGVKFINNEVYNCYRTGVQASVDWNDIEMAYNMCYDVSQWKVYGSPCLSIGDDTHKTGSIHNNVIYSTIGKQWGINVDRGAANIDVFDNHIDKNYIGIILGLNKSPDGKNVNNIYLKNNVTTNTINRDYVQKYVDTVTRTGNSFDMP